MGNRRMGRRLVRSRWEEKRNKGDRKMENGRKRRVIRKVERGGRE